MQRIDIRFVRLVVKKPSFWFGRLRLATAEAVFVKRQGTFS